MNNKIVMTVSRQGILIVLILVTFFGRSLAQGDAIPNILIRGKVINAVDSTPVEARITCESLPYNTDVHFLQSSDSSGLFSGVIHENADYSILVDAPYFKPEMDTVKATEITEVSMLYKLIPINVGQVLKLQNMNFPQGEYKILESSYGELTELLYLLNEYPDMIIRLEGHTDRQGGRQSNMILSENRVKSIRTYLINHGISSKRVQIKAFGGTRPVALENTEEARRANRRVEVRILKI